MRDQSLWRSIGRNNAWATSVNSVHELASEATELRHVATSSLCRCSHEEDAHRRNAYWNPAECGMCPCPKFKAPRKGRPAVRQHGVCEACGHRDKSGEAHSWCQNCGQLRREGFQTQVSDLHR